MHRGTLGRLDCEPRPGPSRGAHLEELFEQLPILLLPGDAGHVFEGMHLDISREIAREDFGVQEAVAEVPAPGKARKASRRAQWGVTRRRGTIEPTS